MRALLAELRPAEDTTIASAAEGAMPEIGRVRRDGLEAALRLHIADIARDGLQIDLDCDRIPSRSRWHTRRPYIVSSRRHSTTSSNMPMPDGSRSRSVPWMA